MEERLAICSLALYALFRSATAPPTTAEVDAEDAAPAAPAPVAPSKAESAPAATSDPVVLPRGQTRSHTVAAGESYWSISRRYRVSMAELLKANSRTENDALHVDDVLRIPDSR